MQKKKMPQVHRFKINKLIRDRLPKILQDSGVEVFKRIMDKEEYVKRLKDKLQEETKEVICAVHTENIVEELADLLEVMKAYARVHEVDFEHVLQACDDKRKKKGGFDKRIYGAFIEMPSTHPDLSYYKARPEDYPEVA